MKTIHRLSFIATRSHGVETYRFAGLSQTYTLRPAEHGYYDLGVLRYPTRRAAISALFDEAAFTLQRLQSRY